MIDVIFHIFNALTVILASGLFTYLEFFAGFALLVSGGFINSLFDLKEMTRIKLIVGPILVLAPVLIIVFLDNYGPEVLPRELIYAEAGLKVLCIMAAIAVYKSIKFDWTGES